MSKIFYKERSDRKYYFVVLLLLIVNGCGINKNDTTAPDYVLEMENVTIFSEDDVANADTIRLIKEQEFGNTEDVYINNISEFTTDEAGRVFIADVDPRSTAIHVYSPDGSYITRLGREGRGPGEFNSLCCLKIRSNRLYVIDKALARLTVYSTDSWDLLETRSMDLDNVENAGQLKEKRLWNYYFLDDETRFLAFINPQKNFEEAPGSIHYFTADTTFQELGEEVLEQDQILEVWGDWNGQRLMKYYPFYSKPLVAVTPTGRIFFADSDQFLIRELNKEGDKVGGFYYPFQRVPVDRNEVFGEIPEMEKSIAENVELPEFWPVIQTMWSDDNGRLWISTFTENEDELEWWVVEPDGKLIGKFLFPGDRNAYPLINGGTFKHIRGDYFYAREEDEKTGLQTVVRYKIEME
ncbi:MAG: 6-bladed beta-propeller [Balneolaceae bacterium]